jgi:hypothetical protein
MLQTACVTVALDVRVASGGGQLECAFRSRKTSHLNSGRVSDVVCADLEVLQLLNEIGELRVGRVRGNNTSDCIGYRSRGTVLPNCISHILQQGARTEAAQQLQRGTHTSL